MKTGGQIIRSLIRVFRFTAYGSLLTTLGCFGDGGGGSTDLTFKVEFRAESLSPRDPDSLEILIYSPDARRSPVREAPDCSADPADPLAGEKLFRQSFEFKNREARVSFTAPSQDVDIVLAARSGDQAVFIGGKRVAVNAGGVTDAGTFELREIIAGAAPAFISCQGLTTGSCLMGRTKAVDLAWDPVPAATHYWVCARKSDEARYKAFRADSARMSFPPKGSGFSMEDDAEYTFKLLAVNDHQTSLFSEEVVAKTIQRPSLPTAKVESTTIVVTIPFVENATLYRIYYDTDGPGEPYEGRKPAATEDSPLEVPQGAASAKILGSIEGARMGALYFLAVSAVNEESKSESFLSPEIKVAVPYAAPKNLKAVGRTGRVELRWDPLPAELTGPGLAPPGSLIEAGSQPRFAVFYGTEPPSKDDDNDDGVEAAEGKSPIYVTLPVPGSEGVNIPELVVSGLENGKTHYFAVRTQNDFAQSDYSDEVSAVPLAVPANLQATTFGDLESKSTAIEFTFDKVDKAAAYRIFASASPPASAPALTGPRAAFPAPAESILGAPVMTVDSTVCTTTCKAKWTGVTPNTAFKLGVTAAISTVSESDLPPAKSFTSAPAPPVIVTPGKPALGAVASTGRVTLNWASVAGAIGYKVHYNADPGGGNPAAYVGTGATNGNSPVSVSGTSLTLKGLTDAKEINIAVSAFSATGESNLSNEVSAVPLAVPAGLALLNVSNSLALSHLTGQLPLRWNPVEKADCYKLEHGASAGSYTSSVLVSQEKGKTFGEGSICTGAIDSDYADQAECAAARCALITGLTNNSARHFVVSALRDGSGVKTESDRSASFSATPIAKPTNFVAKGRTSRVELSWTAVTGATSGYEVRWSDPAGQDHLAKPPNNVITSACTAVTLCAAAGTPGCAVTASGICPSVVAIPSGATFPANGTTNTFSIVAMNASGRSDQSDDAATPLAAPVMSGAGDAKDMDDVRLVFEWQRGVCPLAICPSYGSCATGEACPTYKVGYDTASRAGTLKISDYKGTGATEGSSTLANTSCINGGINERCQINGLQTNTSYYLSAAATTTSGDESDPMTEVAMTSLLGQVQNLKVTMGTAKAVLTWDPVAKATAYDVFVDAKGISCPPNELTMNAGTVAASTSATITVLNDGVPTPLGNGTRYCFSVEARIGAGACKPAPAPGANSPANNCGEPMTNLEGIPIPAATTLVEPTYVGGAANATPVRKDQFTVRWDAPAAWTPPDSLGIDKFRFYYDTDAPGAPYNGTGATQGNSPVELKPGDLGCAPGSSTCTFTLSGLQPNTTYYYAIAAANTKGDTDGYSLVPSEGASGPFAENGESDLLIPAGLFIRTLLPDLQNLKVTTTTDQATASWSAVTGATQYRLYYLQHLEDNPGPPPAPPTTDPCPAVDIADDLDHTNGDGNPAGTTNYSTATDACSFPSGTIVSSTSKTLTCMKNAGFMTGTNDSYCFRVVAESTGGSNHSDFSTPQVASPLKIPGCFAAVVGGTQIQLSWCAVARATGYRIYYDTNPGTPYTGSQFNEGASPIVVSGQATASATVNLPAGTPPTTFYFTLTAIRDANGDGDTIDSSDGESAMAPELTTQSSLAAPGNFSVIGQTGADTQNGVTETFLDWAAVTGASCYRVFYDSDTAGAPYVEETTEVPPRVASSCQNISGTCESKAAASGDPCSTGASSAGGLGPIPSTKTDLILEGLDFGVQYHFAVRAYTTTSSSPYTSDIALIPLDRPTVSFAPLLAGDTDPVSGLTCANSTPKPERIACIVVQWTPVSGAGTYSLYYDEDSGSPPFEGTAFPPTSGGDDDATCTAGTACGCEGMDSAADGFCDGEIATIPNTRANLLLSGLRVDRQYFIVVQAVGPPTENNRGDLSVAPSSAVSTPIPAPSNLTGTIAAIPTPGAPASSSISLNWNPVTITTGINYDVRYTREDDNACPATPPGTAPCAGQVYTNAGGDVATSPDCVGPVPPAEAQYTKRCNPNSGTLNGLNKDTIYHIGVQTRGGSTPEGTPTYFPYSRRTLDAERPTFSSQPVSVDSTGAAKSLFKGGETKNGTHPGDAACHTGETTTVNPATDCDLPEDVIILKMTVRDYIHKLSSGNVARFTADFSAIDSTAAAGTAVPACVAAPPASCPGLPGSTMPGVGAFRCEFCPPNPATGDAQYWIKYRINTASTIADGSAIAINVTANDQRGEANTGAGNSRQSSNVAGLTLDNTRPTTSLPAGFTVPPLPVNTKVITTCPPTAGTTLCPAATTGQAVQIRFDVDETLSAAPTVKVASRLATLVSPAGPPWPAGSYEFTFTPDPLAGDVSGNAVITAAGTDLVGNDFEDTDTSLLLDFEVPSVCNGVFTTATAPTSPNVGFYNNLDKIRLDITAADPGTDCPVGSNGLTVRVDFNAIDDAQCDPIPGPDVLDPCRKICTTVGGSCSVEFQISGANGKGDGSYTISATATDLSGIESSAFTINATLDNTAPVVTAAAPGDTANQFKTQNSGPINVTWTSTETNKDTALVELYSASGGTLQGVIEAASSGNDDGTTSWAAAPNPELSTLRIGITATDKAGNVSNGGVMTPSANDFTLDNTNPTVAISVATPGETAGNVVRGTKTVLWATTDANPDQAEIRYSTDNTTCNLGTFSSVILPFAGANDDGTEDWATPATDTTCANWNKFCFKISVKDKAGNSGLAYSTNPFTVDNTAPIVSISAPLPADAWGNTPAKNITWTITECNRDTVNPVVQIYRDAGTLTYPFTESGGTADTGTFAWTLPAGQEIATSRLRLVLADKAGNSSGNSDMTGDFTIDTLAPGDPPHAGFALTFPNGGEVLSGNLTPCPGGISWSLGTEPNPGTSNLDLTTDPAATCSSGTFTNIVTGTTGACSPWNTTAHPDAVNYKIRLTHFDTAGNSSCDFSDSAFTVDNTAPTCSVSGITETSAYAYVSGTEVWYNTASADSFVVNVTASDGVGSGVQKVNFPATVSPGGDDTTSPFSLTYNWDGADTYFGLSTATVFDIPGNTDTCNFTVTRDIAAPAGGSISYLNGFTNNPATNNVTFSSGTDNLGGSGINTATVELQRQSATMTVGVCGGYGAFGVIFTGPVSPYTDSTVVDGNCYKYRLVVTDNVGNQAIFTSTDELKVDTFNPATPIVGLIAVTQNPPASNDTITGAAGAVEGSATLKVYKGAACAVVDLTTSFAVAADGSFPATSILDNQADAGDCVYYKAADAAGNESACSTCDTNDVTAPTPPVSGNLTLTENQPGTNDTLSGSPVAVEGSATVRVYSDPALTAPALIASTAALPDGSFLAFSIGDNQGNGGVDPNVVYVVARDTAGNQSTPTTKQNDRTAPTCLVSSITEGLNEAFASGTTVWYNNNSVGGSFTVNVLASDTGGSSMNKVNFPVTVNSGGGDDALAPYNMLYTWIVADTYSALATVTAFDNALNTSTCDFTVTRDTTVPSAGSVTYANGFIITTSTSVTLVNGSDNVGGSGLGVRDLQRRSAALTGTVCGAFGGWGSIATNPSSPYDDTTLVDVNCYEYRYVVPDNVANQVIYTSPNTIKVDATPPAPPVAGNMTLTENLPGTNDTLSGAAGAAESETIIKVYSDSTLTTLIGCTGNNPPTCSGTVAGDGSFVVFDIGDNLADITPEPDTVYVVAVDTAGNKSTPATQMQNDKTPPSCNVSLISEGTNPNNQHVNGTTIFYNTAVGGDFTVTAAASDQGGGTVQSVSFPLTVSAGGVDAAAPYTQLYTWTVASGFSGGANATATDSAGNNSTTCAFTVTRDVLPPAGGSVSYTNGFITTTSATISVDDGTDTGSDIATRNLERRDAVLTGSVCGAFGGWATVATPAGGAQSVPETLTDGNCYEYRYEVIDNVGNTVIYTSASQLKVDTTPPAAPDGAKIQINMVASPAQDQAAPTAAACPSPPGTGAVGEAGATLKVYKESSLTTLLGSGALDAAGCFTAFDIGDNQAEAVTSLVYFIVTDPAGNPSTSISKTNDITAPTFGSATPNKTDFKDGDTITITVDWGETGLTGAPASVTANYTNIDSGGPAADACAGAGPTYTCDWPITLANSKADGNYTIPITATDAAGNATTNSSLSLTLDNTAPVIVGVTSDKDTYRDGDIVTLTVDTTPNETSTSTATAPFNSAAAPNTPVDDQCVAPCTQTGTFSAGVEFTITYAISALNTVADSPPPKTVEVTVTDAAGNSDTMTASFNLDNNPPAVPTLGLITVNMVASPANDTITGAATAVEGGATVRVYKNTLCTTLAVGFTPFQAAGDGSFAAPQSIGNNQADLANCIYLTATDAAGNVSACSGCKTNDITAPGPPSAVAMTLTENQPGTNDTLSGAAGAVENGATVKVYRDAALTLLNSSTAASPVDGSFASFSIGDNLANGLVNPNVVYVVAVDAAGNASTSTTEQNDITNPTCAVSSITETAAESYTTGTTVWYNNASVDGSFTVTVGGGGTTDDGGSGIEKVTFPATVSVGGDDSTSPYSFVYNWEDAAPGPASTYSALATATIYDNAGNTDTCNFTVTRDTTAPGAGAMTYSTTTTNNTSVSVTWTLGSDNGGGAGIGTCDVERRSDPYVNGACPGIGAAAWGAVTTQSPTCATSYADVVAGNNCYQFRIVLRDNVTNAVTYAGGGTLKVDTTSPTVANLSIPDLPNQATKIFAKGNTITIDFSVQGEGSAACLATAPTVTVSGSAASCAACVPDGGNNELDYSCTYTVVGTETKGAARPVNISVQDDAGNTGAGASTVALVYGAKGTWPFTAGNFVRSSPALANIDGDAALEVLVGSNDNTVYGMNPNKTNATGWPKTAPPAGAVIASPAVADIDLDTDNEVAICAEDNVLRIFENDGTAACTAALSGPCGRGSPAIGDLDNDGIPEIVVLAQNGANVNVYAFNYAGGGGCPSFSVNFPVAITGNVDVTPALANVDGVAGHEIIFGAGDGSVHALTQAGTEATNLCVWPPAGTDTDGFRSSPAVGDVDGDGPLEVVLGNDNGKVFVIDTDTCAVKAGWPKTTTLAQAIRGSPALADLDGNGTLEIIVGGDDGKLYVLKGDGTSFNATWPKNIGGQFESSPAVANVDTDAALEIIVGRANGFVEAYKLNVGGAPENARAVGFPLVTGNASPIRSSVAIDDLDADGTVEIVVGSDDFKIHVWEIGSPSPINLPWPMFHKNNSRSGN